MPSLDQIIKQMALDAVNSSDPTNVMFGTVLSVNPMQIKVDQKITLTSEFLILCRNVTNYSTTVNVEWETSSESVTHNHVLKGSTETTEDAEVELSHKISGKQTITINNGLSAGDEVILLKMQGGQKYVVLDKVGG